MTEKDLRRLSKSDMLELLLRQSKVMRELKEKNAELEEQLKSRKIQLDEAGNIAQAALSLCGVFKAAQNAADMYIENVAVPSDLSNEEPKTDSMDSADNIAKSNNDIKSDISEMLEELKEQMHNEIQSSVKSAVKEALENIISK